VSRAQLWSASGDTEPVTETVERSLDGMQLGPPLNATAIKPRGVGENVQRAVHRRTQIVSLQQRQHTRLEKRAPVVSRVTDVALRIDGQPGLTLGTQDVLRVKVTVNQDVGLDAAELVDSRGGGRQRTWRQCVRQFLGVRVELLVPPVGQLL